MTWKIHIQGQVQGVGFRPFVWRAALDRRLNGQVANGLQGVVIRINGTDQEAHDFQQYILENAPEMARITAYSRAEDTDLPFERFVIAESDPAGLPLLLLPPDTALCSDCRSEIQQPTNRRYRYPFTTCTLCGPRYSILTGLPYDRRLTTMQPFEPCAACRKEYENPADRRYYAQTNSCPDCGIHLSWWPNPAFVQALKIEKTSSHEAIIQATLVAWRAGAIVAVKGLSGYLLTCDASNAASVATLRSRKQRPTKPFALMYPDLARLQKDALLHEAALVQLHSPAAPIVLLALREKDFSGLDRPGIAPGLQTIGAMLPNAPLLDILLRDFGGPIVATSGNLSHAPLIYQDEVALRDLSAVADFILLHDREIVLPQDDSVVALRRPGPFHKSAPMAAPVVLRRARGLAPTFIQPGLRVPEGTVLALGAEMKSTFTLAHLGNVHVGPYLGDLSDFDVQQRFQHALDHLLGLFHAQPTLILGDLHPGYFSTQLGQTLAEKWQAPFRQIQHHEAHFAAVLAENNLLSAKEEPILGVIWDGTGYGRDGQIWGGEFFIYANSSGEQAGGRMERRAHFGYFPQLLADKMAREPRLSLLAGCFDLPAVQDWLRPKFSDTEWALYRKMCAQPGQLQTSSVGRIFDAVASLLGIADKISYEGEAALLLEDLARQYCQESGFDFEPEKSRKPTLFQPEGNIDTTALFQQIIRDLKGGKTRPYVAAKFHFTLTKLIKEMANRLNIEKIAFSGGVFQNTLLLEMIQYHLGADCQLFFHRQLSPNDENVSFGQWAYQSGVLGF